jgi:hypothetical protein
MVAMPIMRWTKFNATRSPHQDGSCAPADGPQRLPVADALPFGRHALDDEARVDRAKDLLEHRPATRDHRLARDGARVRRGVGVDARFGRQVAAGQVLVQCARDEVGDATQRELMRRHGG